MLSSLRVERQQKISLNSARMIYFGEGEKTNMFIRSRGPLENHTRS